MSIHPSIMRHIIYAFNRKYGSHNRPAEQHSTGVTLGSNIASPQQFRTKQRKLSPNASFN